jgi:Asp-tRNA(Asn)/Glu-tRNA(Gln) amidotransferase A subunit family amidase
VRPKPAIRSAIEKAARAPEAAGHRVTKARVPRPQKMARRGAWNLARLPAASVPFHGQGLQLVGPERSEHTLL